MNEWAKIVDFFFCAEIICFECSKYQPNPPFRDYWKCNRYQTDFICNLVLMPIGNDLNVKIDEFRMSLFKRRQTDDIRDKRSFLFIFIVFHNFLIILIDWRRKNRSKMGKLSSIEICFDTLCITPWLCKCRVCLQVPINANAKLIQSKNNSLCMHYPTSNDLITRSTSNLLCFTTQW